MSLIEWRGRRPHPRWMTLLLAMGAALSGCAGQRPAKTDTDGGLGGLDAGRDTVVAMASESIGPAGGQVTASTGASVMVPPEALPVTTTIGITVLAGSAAQETPAVPAGLQPVGNLVALTPHGQSFTVPATVRVPFDVTLGAKAAARPLRLYTAAPGGNWVAVEGGRVVDGAMEGGVNHFSYFIVGYETPGQTFPEVQGRKLDLLFMIDNSASMFPLQQKLLANFPMMMQVLQDLPEGLPDIHIGVVSSSMGAGKFSGVPGCPVGGDNGVLQFAARVDGCSAPRDPFIAAGEREITKNYDGTINSAFSCIAALGDHGCGFEQSLESVAVALGARGTPPPENAGFLRPDALLGIVLITNEDDCSAPSDANLFDPASTLLSDPYGPLWSYRCNEYGHRCQGGATPPRVDPGSGMVTLTECHSAEDGILHRISEYAQLFKALKSDPNQVFITAIAGPPTPYAVTWGTGINPLAPEERSPMILHSCMSGMSISGAEYADPPPRLADLVSLFGSNGTLASICDPSFAPALTQLGLALGQRLGPRCLQAAVLDASAAPSLHAGCAIHESVPLAGGQRSERALRACGTAPCFRIAANPACTSGAELVIDRTDTAPAGASLVVRCE